VTDPELAAEAERDRLKALAGKFSAEDLMRAFDVLTKAEFDIRGSAYPRYHLEMALLRWIHLRKLVPISDLIQNAEKGGVVSAPRVTTTSQTRSAATPGAPADAARARTVPLPRPPSAAAATVKAVEARTEARTVGAPSNGDAMPNVQPVSAADLKDAFLNEVRKSKKFFYGTVVAQAQRIDIERDHVVFTFAPQHRALRVQLDQSRTWLDALASQLSGRKMTVASAEGASTPSKPGAAGPAAVAPEKDRQSDLRQQALADSAVQAMLDVFAAEIKDVEER
jgi:DNA polymerase-3 subunit gamma/tau